MLNDEVMSRKQAAVQNLVGLKQAMKVAQDAVNAQLEELSHLLAPGEIVEVDGTPYEWQDNFAGKNTTYRPACFHRFDLKEAE
jgi:hypothetical protein